MPFKSWILALALLCPCAAFAAEPAASEASIRELLDVTRARSTIDTMLAQMDGMMSDSMRQAAAGEPLSEAQQALLDQMRGDMVALFQEEMAWHKLEPTLLEVYRASFTQAEVDGMLDFYRTDAGKAVIAKMPVVMQNSMKLTQERLAAIMPRMQALQQKYLDKIKAGN